MPGKGGIKKMNVKELAQFTGKTEQAVRNWIKKAASEEKSLLRNKVSLLQKGHDTDFNINEVEEILLSSSMSHDAVSILIENAKESKQPAMISSDLTAAITALAVSMQHLADVSAGHESRLERIEERITERAALLPPPQISPRTHINMLMRDLAHNKNMEYRDAWKELYKQFGYRTNSNPAMCAQNRDMKIIDYIDAEGQMGILESVAMEICR